ncbi:hypothetical protein ACFU5O_28130 [Streptomyces sp. NPDC057445]|uniref:hypothetical protein n=1 Tax=Streptomyces sp. NPDC057445 TaxID=3346136 RepID=UPI0036CAB8DC
MDVGTAAVISAGIGIGGALLGAVGGGGVTSRNMRRQVKDQADVEHRHWLRQQRQDAYAAFLTACDTVLDTLQSIAALRENPDPQVDMGLLWDAYDEAYRTVVRASTVVNIAGPDAMRQQAFRLQRYFTELSKIYRAPPDPESLWPWDMASIVYHVRHKKFVSGARIVLTAPPTKEWLQGP